jgi:hypothetical protein
MSVGGDSQPNLVSIDGAKSATSTACRDGRAWQPPPNSEFGEVVTRSTQVFG